MATATLRFIEQVEYCDEAEMQEIRADKKLMGMLKRGNEDYVKGRYRVVPNR